MISKDLLVNLSNEYKDKNLRTLQNAVIKNGIVNAITDSQAIVDVRHVFSVDLKTSSVANQKASGRCWIFAAMNMFRHKIEKELNLERFELSQTYLFFYDKLEKSNYFLNAIIETVDEELDSRLVRHLLQTPQQDGGQWDMIVSLIQKYGVVPIESMPDTATSMATNVLNNMLNKKLRKNAEILRKAYESGKKVEELHKMREEMLKDVYTLLAVTLGQPPKEVIFEIYNKDNKLIYDKLSPVEFYNKYVNIDLDEYVSVINAPTKDKPYNKTYTVKYLGNVLGGKQIKYLNVDMEILKEVTRKQIANGESVWFGCDVGQLSQGKLGMLDMDILHYDSFGIDFEMEKTSTLDYSESLMTHAMLLTGYNEINGVVNRWKVENSWGTEVGDKGYYVMTTPWMDRFTYQVVVSKKYIPEYLVHIFETEEPKELKPWDPMGALAK